jgi:hypothetical protein
MFPTKRILALSALVALAALTSCNGDIDDPDGPNVFLEAENLVIPPVTAATDETTGACTFTLTNSNATFRNKPKNEAGATSPFNDIVLESVLVSYDWGVGGAPLPDAQFGIGGVVPANGTAPAQFSVISANALIPYEGQSAGLTLTFLGHTISGEPVAFTTGGSLNVSVCQ